MNVAHQITSIFCEVDDFCNELEEQIKGGLICGPNSGRKKRGPCTSLSDAEIMTILIMFQNIRYRDFKTFYCCHVQKYWQNYFPNLPSYNRFVELMKLVIFPLTLFAQAKTGKKTGIYYIDSTSLPACKLIRSKRNRTFKNVAKYGKTSVGWFFGLKLHIVINEQGELMAFKITKGNRHDSKEAVSLFAGLDGVAFGDKGYISKKITAKLLEAGLKLITKVRKNMKEKIDMSKLEKQLLNQRGIIETVIDHLKHHYQVWHTRHRSALNALTHLISAIAAYTLEPLKISALKMLEGCDQTTNSVKGIQAVTMQS